MKIRFAQLEAAHAAFGRYAAILVAKTRVQSGGSSLPHPQGAALMLTKDNPLSDGHLKQGKAFPEAIIQDSNLPAESPTSNQENSAIINGDVPSSSSNFFKDINFFVEHQNKYCQEFVEYVFSAWARGLDMNQTLPLTKTYALSMARTSVDENQI